MVYDTERLFTDLLFRASRKYASWDPEVPVYVGDYGRITRGRTSPWRFWKKGRGSFLKEGNIYTDGFATEYDIPPPEEHGVESSEGATWITSKNARQIEVAADVAGQTPALTTCRVKAAFAFKTGRGAILVMDNDTISRVPSPGKLRRLLDETRIPKGSVIVSEVHRASSYARYLSAKNAESIAVGLAAEAPMANVASVNASVKWVHSATAGNFKAKANKSGKRVFYPLFRLVALTDNGVATGLRGEMDEDAPLPDAEPPWDPAEAEDDETGS